jgi:transcription antitermination protein NusB
MSGRRAARRTAVFLLYQWDVTGQPLASLYEGEVDPYACGIAEGVIARSKDLDARITAAAEDWPAERLGVVERNVLRVALVELEGDEVPDEVAINEAVELAKRYASDEAARLVNGILGRIAREQVA